MRWLLLILCVLISAYGQASELKSLLPPVRLAVVNSFGSNLSVRYFNDTVKARYLDKELSNRYVPRGNRRKVRAQMAIYDYLKSLEQPD